MREKERASGGVTFAVAHVIERGFGFVDFPVTVRFVLRVEGFVDIVFVPGHLGLATSSRMRWWIRFVCKGKKGVLITQR